MTAQDDQSVAKTASFLYGQDQSLTYTATDRRLAVDNRGYLYFIAGGGGATSAVTVTSLPVYVSVSNPAYTVLSSTATSRNITSEAGTSANYDLAISNNYGGSAIRYAITFSSGAPSDLSTRGAYLAATSTVQIDGTWGPGAHLHMYSVGTAPTGNDVSVYYRRRGNNTANP
jgi:hypothetical protein